MLALFTKLLLAHILGDFVFQPSSLVQKRQKNALYLLLHILLHGILLCLFFINNLSSFYLSIAFILISHLAIDSLKILIEKKSKSANPTVLFIMDQCLHIAVLLAITIHTLGINTNQLLSLYNIQNLLYLTAFLLSTVVSPTFLRIYFGKWNRDGDFENKKEESLIDAGLLIGIIERLIIILFIQVNFLSGIGFLLAAKSIFRFGDLTNAKNTKYTEYILLGTLCSFLIAIIIGYLLKISLSMV